LLRSGKKAPSGGHALIVQPRKYLPSRPFPRHRLFLHDAGAREEATMTPEERNLVSDLFGRLATVENSPRDPEAERVIKEGLTRAPNAIYALVQTTLVQDEALKHADERIRALESQLAGGGQQQSSGGFLAGGPGSRRGR